MMRNKKRAISNFFILLVLVAGISWVCGKFIHLGSVEYTDNAQVKQHLTPVSTRVQGFIKKICFEEYQTVKKGDTLAIIEDTEYRLKVAQAEADYRNALAGKSAMHTTINTTQNNILVTDAAIDEQRIRLQNAQTDYKRYQELLKEEAVTPQQFDRVKRITKLHRHAMNSCYARNNRLYSRSRSKPSDWNRMNRLLNWQRLHSTWPN